MAEGGDPSTNASPPSSNSLSVANLTVNPFETESLDSMHLPAFSPSVFKPSQDTPRTKSKKDNDFRWSIDQMSLLFPADIDERPLQQETSILTKEKEQQVQEAITQFFNQKTVVPSPWSESRPMKHVTFSPNPPSVSVLSEHSAENSVNSPPNSSFLNSLTGRVDASCQTSLTLPLDFDLEGLLGKGRFLYTKSSVESFPLAPLRRKLFTQSESSSVPSASPESARESGPFSPSLSPIRSSQESGAGERRKGQVPLTPSSVESQFSSSPITPHRRTPLGRSPHVPHQASPLCGTMESPSISPIKDLPSSQRSEKSPDNLQGSTESDDHFSPHRSPGSPAERLSGAPENMMETSLVRGGPLNCSWEESEIGDGDVEAGKDGKEWRKNFTLGLEGELSPIHKTGDQISPCRVPVCSSRLQGPQEESVMDTSLFSHGDNVRDSSQVLPSSPIKANTHGHFSLGTSTSLSPIPKTRDSPPHHQEVPTSPSTDKPEKPRDMDRHQSSSSTTTSIANSTRLKQQKMVSFHIDTEFSPIRSSQTGDRSLCQTVPVTSSRVHDSNAEGMMDTSLFSVSDKRATHSSLIHQETEFETSPICRQQGHHGQGRGLVVGMTMEGDDNRPIADASSISEDEGKDQDRCCDQRAFSMRQNVQVKSEMVSSLDSRLHVGHIQDTSTTGTRAITSSIEGAPGVNMTCNHGSGCWVSDTKSDSMQHEGGKWQLLHSTANAAKRLTSTMRYGTPFLGCSLEFPDKPGEDGAEMDVSSVSVIHVGEDHEEDAVTEGNERACVIDDGAESLALRSFHGLAQARGDDRDQGHSRTQCAAGRLSTSRSYDSLREVAEATDDERESEDWLMLSLSEADLHCCSTSSDRSLRDVTNQLNLHPAEWEHCVHSSHADQRKSLPKGLPEGYASHGHFFTGDHKPSQRGEPGIAREYHISGMKSDSHGPSKQPDGSAFKVLKEELTPLRPFLLNLIPPNHKGQADSGYNTNSVNSATSSMDVIDIVEGDS
ncbi:uncharacterized protein [Diadema setosum]|uniref:uncharacterized protein n=1 Tax=Diadema setosum TaxID=31175 RepID=UPI003B3ACBE5